MSTTDKQIKKIEANVEELKSLAETAQKMVVTKETIKDADRFRITLKNKLLDIQRQEKHNNEIIKEMKRLNEERAAELISIIAPAERELDTKIKAIEEEERRRKEEAERVERERVLAHRKNISSIEFMTASIRTSNNVQFINECIEKADAMLNKFEEFNEEGNEAISVLKMSAENRLLHLSSIKDKESSSDVANSVLSPRERELLDMGFVKGEYSWQKGGQSIPFSVLGLPDDAWSALLKTKGSSNERPTTTQVESVAKAEKQSNNNTANGVHGLNIFVINGYSFGIDKKAPLNKVLSLRKLIADEINKW